MYTGVHNTRINNLPSDRHPHDDVTTTPHTSRRLLGEAPRRGGPPARQGAELRAKANQNHGRPEHGMSLACGRRRPRGGPVGGDGRGYGGGAYAARVLEAASGAPKKNGGLFTFCPGSANGRTPARVPARRRGQLRQCPRWRRKGVALPGRCSRAQRRRGGRVLPRQVTQTTPGAAGPDRTLGRRARLRVGGRQNAQPGASAAAAPEDSRSQRGRAARSIPRAAGLGWAALPRQPRCQPAVRVGASPPYPAGVRKESGVGAPARSHRPRLCHLPQVTGWSWEDAFFRRRRSGLSGAALRVLLRVRAAWGLGAGAGLCAPAGPVAWGWPREGGSDSPGSGSLSRGDQVSKVLVWFARLGWGMGRSD